MGPGSFPPGPIVDPSMSFEEYDCGYADMYDMHDFDASDREEYEVALAEEHDPRPAVAVEQDMDAVLDGDDLPF